MATELWQQPPAHIKNLPTYNFPNKLKKHLLAEQVTYWNNFILIISLKSCTEETVFSFLVWPSMSFLFIVCMCKSDILHLYFVWFFLCLVIVMSCTFQTTFKELATSSKTFRLSSWYAFFFYVTHISLNCNCILYILSF